MLEDQKLFEAIEFAAKAHHGQFRKGTKLPYIIHPLGVAQILIEYACSEEVVIAGLLHDTMEDTPVKLNDIEERFGARIGELVAAVSEDKSKSWEERKQHTLNYLKTAPLEVLLLACADKLHNIKTIQEDYDKLGETLWTRFNRSRSKQKWYYQSLAGLFVSRIENETSRSIFNEFQVEVSKVFGSEDDEIEEGN
jgi:(p)ppGpp synthase/HD superfamily hydrolase